ncbi:MAG: amidohydrolase family protein [Nitrospinota bacterium]
MRSHLLAVWAAAIMAVFTAMGPAMAQSPAPDYVLVNGKLVTVDAENTIAQGIAILGNRIAAIGSSKEIKALAGENTRVVDLGGRTVIPGLIDSHIHAIRGALTFGREIGWTDAKSLQEALAMIKKATAHVPKGEWINVVGGWHVSQFPEKRLPRPEELNKIAPVHPVYVQHLPTGLPADAC